MSADGRQHAVSAAGRPEALDQRTRSLFPIRAGRALAPDERSNASRKQGSVPLRLGLFSSAVGSRLAAC